MSDWRFGDVLKMRFVGEAWWPLLAHGEDQLRMFYLGDQQAILFIPAHSGAFSRPGIIHEVLADEWEVVDAPPKR